MQLDLRLVRERDLVDDRRGGDDEVEVDLALRAPIGGELREGVSTWTALLSVCCTGMRFRNVFGDASSDTLDLPAAHPPSWRARNLGYAVTWVTPQSRMMGGGPAGDAWLLPYDWLDVLIKLEIELLMCPASDRPHLIRQHGVTAVTGVTAPFHSGL